MVEQMLKVYSSTLILRVRMPISDDLSPRNFITKIVKYDRVVNVPNSMTVLYELLPASITMAEKKLSGVYNFCNPGVISHNEMLDLYKKVRTGQESKHEQRDGIRAFTMHFLRYFSAERCYAGAHNECNERFQP